MEKKYSLKLECSINGFAELIASGLPDGCTITKLDVMDAPLKVAAHKIDFKQPARPMLVEPEPVIKKKTSVKKIASRDVYEILKARFTLCKFTARDVYQQALYEGFDCTSGAISGHLSRMRSVALIDQAGGNCTVGYVYVMNELKNKKDFTKAISGYNNKVKAKEQQKSAQKNGWWKLNDLQRQYNAS